ncbi:hypothetical protein [Enterococcus casseliflavus]|uniref:Type I toxin-antitoxin system Fst family toxin n=1 Tax=Enterococcus casseliflavus TaxID=37734 RepID=A0ABD5FKY8_ENTCA|nr:MULTISPECIES: hypothetical protein [Enterococcus]MDT2982763.1 hypothetical protein [Enterococcus casseliflavus]
MNHFIALMFLVALPGIGVITFLVLNLISDFVGEFFRKYKTKKSEKSQK